MMEDHGFDSSEEGEEPQVRKLWQVREAEAELPLVRRVLEELRYLAKQMSEMHMHIGLEEKIAQRLGGLKARGIEIKDLETGLVDFYAMRDGKLVYLCWKEGEKGIHWWHPVNTGFNDRKKLTEVERTSGSSREIGRKKQEILPGYH